MSDSRLKLASFIGLIVIQSFIGVIYKVSINSNGGYSYSPLSALTIAEFIKFCLSSMFHAREVGERSKFWSFLSLAKTKQVFTSIMFLSVMYFINNQIAFYLFLKADPASINLLKAGSSFISAIIWRLWMKRSISTLQWLAIAFQISGLVIVQYDVCAEHPLFSMDVYLVILFSVSLTSFCGVWNEKQLKTFELSLHEQNMILYFFGIFLNLFGFLISKYLIAPETTPNFFEGYTSVGAIGVLVGNSLIGLAVTAVYKYADAIIKTLASAITTVVLLFFSSLYFSFNLNVTNFFGSFIVIIATIMYFLYSQSQPQSNKSSSGDIESLKDGKMESKSFEFSPKKLWFLLLLPILFIFFFSKPHETHGNPNLFILLTSTGKSAHRLGPFTNSFRANQIPHRIDTSLEKYDFIYVGYVCLISDQNRCQDKKIYSFIIDVRDDSDLPVEELVSAHDICVKTSLSTEILEVIKHDDISPTAPLFWKPYGERFERSTRERYLKSKHKYFPLVLKKDLPLYDPRYSNEEKKIVLTTQSFHTANNFGAERMKLYEELLRIIPDRKIFDLDIIEQYSQNKTHRYKSDRLEGKDIYDGFVYLKFLGESYFMINLVGIAGSQPYRIHDACMARTAMISDYIYADGALSFPRYQLNSLDTQRSFMNVELFEQEILNLVENHKSIFNLLMPKQIEWCETYFSDITYIHHILQHLPSQPFKSHLLKQSPQMFPKFYQS